METYGYNNEQNGNTPTPYRSDKKIAAALLGIFLGFFGANKFYMGYSKEGIIQLVISILSCGILSIIPLIEGIIYLTMSDELFDQTYIKNKKAWF